MIEIEYRAPTIEQPNNVVYLAFNNDPSTGSAVLPFGRNVEGSTVFLPFRATHLYSAHVEAGGVIKRQRTWQQTQWSGSVPADDQFSVEIAEGVLRILMPASIANNAAALSLVIYAKKIDDNDGWGRLLPSCGLGAKGGYEDQYLPLYKSVDLHTGKSQAVPRLRGERMRVYQMLPRLFGNVNQRRKPNGCIEENGVGKFHDINEAALSSLRTMGFTHVWLTGLLRQATATDYSAFGLPADDPDLLKGLAGSPYAIKDYFDLCPDYAVDPAERLTEFKALLARLRAQGLRSILDFVPNHVARSYASTIRPELSFGAKDDPQKFFDPQNNFFHLTNQPLRLPTWRDGQPLSPTCRILGTCDGRFEAENQHSRVTGNNVTSATPALNDWYETVKLNYGFEFTTGWRAYPQGADSLAPIPDTWLKMDHVLAYWQAQGVGGFRCDMAHMVPPEFWAWAIGRARARQSDVIFLAEAYNGDPMKVPSGDPLLQALSNNHGNVLFDLLSAGFDGVYDDPSYKVLKAIYDGSGWANDLDGVLGEEFIFQNSLRYAENHDEVRLAGRNQWANVGAHVGRPVAAILYGMSRGPVLLYSGQEVGEPATGEEGFGCDDARTTIFDYWSMPELVKWVNNHRYDGQGLSKPQSQLRAFYSRLINLVGEPAFRAGEFYGLNRANRDNPRFGRLPGEPASGHWLYAYLRHKPEAPGEARQSFLVIANLHPTETLRNIYVQLPGAAVEFLEAAETSRALFTERLGLAPTQTILVESLAKGIIVGDLPALSAFYFELRLL